jgi:RNA polymerase-binding transcription factor DksA
LIRIKDGLGQIGKLGVTRGKAMTSLALRKTQLEARLAALNDRLGAIETELQSHDEKDWEELATAREGDEVLESIGVGAQAEMRAIKAALQRIEVGEYGACVRCGAEISEARLDLLPFTPFCKDCA